MSNVFDMQEGCFLVMCFFCVGEGIMVVFEGVVSGVFFVQMFLLSCMEGEMMVMCVFVLLGVVIYWYSYLCGQFFFVFDGVGFVQKEGSEFFEICIGDVVWFVFGECYWYGVVFVSFFSYFSVQFVMNGKVVDWFGLVEQESVQ